MKRRPDGIEWHFSPCGKKIALIDTTGTVWIAREVPFLKTEAAKKAVRRWPTGPGSISDELRHALKKDAQPPGPDDPQPLPDSALARFRRLVPGPLERDLHVTVAKRAIRNTVVRAGDYLAFQWRASWASLPNVAGARLIQVPRAQFATIEKHFDRLQVLYLPATGSPRRRDEPLTQMRRYLKRQQRTGWDDSTSPVFVVRPLLAPVSEPVVASSADAALFELLRSVGGTMPKAANDA